MPCDTITTVKLKIERADHHLMDMAIKASGVSATFDASTSELIVRNEGDGNKVKRAYSAELIRQNASKFGWRVKQTGENRFRIQKG